MLAHLKMDYVPSQVEGSQGGYIDHDYGDRDDDDDDDDYDDDDDLNTIPTQVKGSQGG